MDPTSILPLVLNPEFTFMEILWSFPIYLESFMMQKIGKAESIISHYLFALDSVGALYILNVSTYEAGDLPDKDLIHVFNYNQTTLNVGFLWKHNF